MSRTIPGTSQAAGRPSSPSPAAPARPAYWPGPESPPLWGHATRGRERRRGRRRGRRRMMSPLCTLHMCKQVHAMHYLMYACCMLCVLLSLKYLGF